MNEHLDAITEAEESSEDLGNARKKAIGTAAVGSTVTVHLFYDADDREILTFKIVGSDDINLQPDSAIKSLSADSPIGKAVVNKKAGDEISFPTPGGVTVKGEIVNVECPNPKGR